MIEFVSYNGKYPNLCRGDLVLRIDGKLVNLGKCLCSGGSCGFRDDNWREDYIDYGPWLVDVPDEYKEYTDEITEVVNDNVPFGCCGGCL